MEVKEIGLYIHIPFCRQKCYYCDFVSFANRDDMIERYVNCLKQEIIKYAQKLLSEGEESIILDICKQNRHLS